MKYDLDAIACSEEWFELSGWTNASGGYAKLLELAKIRNRLREESLSLMTEKERYLYEQGEDPFSDASRYEEALAYASDIIKAIEKLAYVDVVSVDYYHADSLVMTAHLNTQVNWRVYREDIPEVWKGIPIFVLQPASDDALDA